MENLQLRLGRSSLLQLQCFSICPGISQKMEILKKQKINRILIPYIIWSILWFAETLWSGSKTISTWNLINVIFFGGAFFPLYFLIVLVELKLVTPMIYRHLNREGYFWYKDWLLLITPITLAVFYLYQYRTGRHPIIYAQIFLTWFLPYYLGILSNRKLIKTSSIKALVVTLLSIYLMTVESTYLDFRLGVPSWAASQIKYSSVMFSIALCMLFMELHQNTGRNFLVVLGELSFGIYLLHIPIKMGIEMIITKVLPITSPLWQLIIVVMTLFVCVMVIKISHHILPEKINRYLGLK